MKIGLIGAGAIANFLLDKVNYQKYETMEITSVFVRHLERYQFIAEKYHVQLFTNLEAFLNSDINIVVEAANIEAVKLLLPDLIKQKDVVVISIGAFADQSFLNDIKNLAQESGHVVHFPSGAIGGLDLLQNANALGTVTHVSLTTRKPAHTLIGEKIQEEKVVFAGKAVDAIEQFPKNVNVSIALSLAGLGVERTNVTLIADPFIDKNIHQVDVEGDFGQATFTIANNPLPENPKTSYLAAMSILGILERMGNNFSIGG